jgi:UDP-glucose 4-epimerase
MTEYSLITGGLGYIGSHTVVEMVNLDMHVIIVDNLGNSSIKCLERLREIT